MATMGQAAAAYSDLAKKLDDLAVAAVNTVADHAAAHMVTKYMRNAKGESPRRSPEDKGPLRIVSTRLVRSFTGARGAAGVRRGKINVVRGVQMFLRNKGVVGESAAPESIRKLRREGKNVVLRWGSRTPYARRHAFNPKFDYFFPAITDAQVSARPVIKGTMETGMKLYLRSRGVSE